MTKHSWGEFDFCDRCGIAAYEAREAGRPCLAGSDAVRSIANQIVRRRWERIFNEVRYERPY